jgi:L-methionine (R)-S-oxide reductase
MNSESSVESPLDENYGLILEQLECLVNDTALPPISHLSNAVALLYHSLPSINWAGFYFLKKDTLFLGPFQGRVACNRIPLGRGVCGKAAKTRLLINVPNVHDFDGHIACDSRSKSEMVMPLVQEDDQVFGVLDIDSPIENRFGPMEEEFIQEFVRRLLQHVDLSRGLL